MKMPLNWSQVYVHFVLYAVCRLGQCNRCRCSSSHLGTPHRFSNIIHYYLQVIICQLLPCPSLTSSRLFQCLSVTSHSLHHCPPVDHSRSAIGHHRLSTVTRPSKISASHSSLFTKQSLRRLKVCLLCELLQLYHFTCA